MSKIYYFDKNSLVLTNNCFIGSYFNQFKEFSKKTYLKLKFYNSSQKMRRPGICFHVECRYKSNDTNPQKLPFPDGNLKR